MAHAGGVTAAAADERPEHHRRFIAQLERTAAAAQAVGTRERAFDIGGHRVVVRFAGPALEESLTRGLLHLESGRAGAADLVVDVWDSASTGTTMPPPPWGRDDYLEHGRIRGYFGDGLHAVYWAGASSLSVVDGVGRRAWHWMPSPEAQPFVITAGPFHAILHVWAATHDLQYVHAAAVGTEEGCVVLVGPGGRGKSSTALACLAEGMGFLGDDYLLVTGDGGTAHSLFCSAKLDEEGLERMPWLADEVGNPVRAPGEKAIVFLTERIVRRAPIRALVLPQVADGSGSSTRPATSAEAFVAVAPSTALQLAGADPGTLRRLRRLTDAVPAFHLELGSDRAGIARAVRGLLTR